MSSGNLRTSLLLVEKINSGQNLIVVVPLESQLPEPEHFFHFTGRDRGKIILRFTIPMLSERLPPFAHFLVDGIDFEQKLQHDKVPQTDLFLVKKCLRPVFDRVDDSAPSLVGKLLIKNILLEEFFPSHDQFKKSFKLQRIALDKVANSLGFKEAVEAILFNHADRRDETFVLEGKVPKRNPLVKVAANQPKKKRLHAVIE